MASVSNVMNLSNVDAPVFGSEPDWNQLHRYGKILQIEMLRFADEHKDPDKLVNVLHVSTDLESAQGTIDRLVLLMGEMGFNCQREDGLYVKHDRSCDADVDVVIIGCDRSHHDDVAYFIQKRISHGFLEISPELDVLWYGTDYSPQLDAKRPLLYSDHDFSVKSSCMIHAHIRRRDNIEMLRGLCISMMVRIENIIDGMLNTWNKGTRTKIHRFEDRVRKDGRWGPDADLFFATLNIIRNARNMAAHSNEYISNKKQLKRKLETEHLTDTLNKLADRYERRYLKFKHDISFPNTYYRHLKWMSGLAQIAVAYITDYHRICTQQS